MGGEVLFIEVQVMRAKKKISDVRIREVIRMMCELASQMITLRCVRGGKWVGDQWGRRDKKYAIGRC